MRLLRHLVVGLGLLLSAIVHAQTPVPPQLDAWRGWVLKGQEFRACPLIAGKAGTAAEEFLCAWPGVLALNADANGVGIAQRWHVDVESWVPLPGNDEYWPQQVTVDGKPAPVVDHEGPALRLGAGNHDIRARIPWRERPQALHVPAEVGLVALNVDGKPVVPVQRDGDELTLGRGEVEETEADSMDLRVYRKLADGIPATLTTTIQLNVSGRAREELIGPALPAGFEPLALISDGWPARLEADGRLRVQVQPGSDVIHLTARAVAPLAKVTARVPETPWPQQEIWSYDGAPRLRVTSATSALQVDPRQAEVPDEWSALPAFALGDGAALTIEERSRGLADDEKNRLTLDREMWLDFSGDGWFSRDRIAGEMLRGWRFDVAPPFKLERADALSSRYRDRNGENLLVTRGALPDSTGVEWRTPRVDLGAGVRIAPNASSIPVSGWQDSFDRVTTTLHLPSGYKLLGAPGADSAAGSWISEWSLLDVFIAAILALLAWRLFGFVGVAIAIGYLVLGYQESGAPLWTLLAALALGLVARALPDGKLSVAAEWIRRAVLVALVLFALPFVANELRYALHPQLENGAGYGMYFGQAENTRMFRHRANLAEKDEAAMQAPTTAAPTEALESPPPPPADIAADVESKSGSAGGLRRDLAKVVPEPRKQATDRIDHYSDSTIVQTGTGEPSWNLGERYVLSWSGPVLPAQSVRLVIAPPWLVRLLRIVLVALLAWLIVRMVRTRPAIRTGAALAGMLAFCAVAMPPRAQAQAFPPDELLNALRTQLIEAPKCAPNCAAIAGAEISARGDEVRVVLEAHAADRVALPVPIDEEALALRSITIDGSSQDGIARDDGGLWIALSRGVHRVELTYTASADKIALAFPLKPMRARFSGDGWQASGIGDDRLLTETLTLARARESSSGKPVTGTQQFAPFVRVERNLNLGLDWTATTIVQRLAPQDGGFTVSVPVIAGEHVSTAGLKVDKGEITAAIADGANSTEWSSTLDKGDALTLTAPALDARAEVWSVLVSPTWHMESSGVPMVAEETPNGEYRRFEFHPLPGEKLTLRITRPQAAEGATRAIDRATLTYNAGQRAADSTLDLSMRASQGGEQVITLPSGAEVLNVSRNGTPLNLRPRDGKLSLPLLPGPQQFQIHFREETPIGFNAQTPAIALGLAAANIDLVLNLPADRWLLATRGPAAGPAVLYWSELAVMLLIAWALARTRRTPLKLWQWVLLGIGFSTFSWLALVVVVAWLFALDWRTRAVPLRSVPLFNLAQIALALLTAVALLCLVAAIPQGLLGSPDMHVAGNGSMAQSLRWFADRSADALPQAGAISVPLWVYKIAMLAWALWLASAVIGWLRYGFAAWTREGYWRRAPRPVVDVPAQAAPPTPAKS